MRITIHLFLCICIALAANADIFAQELDSAYHNNDEILAELAAYAEEYPEWMTLDSIGHSAEFGLPIWMVKISDNPDQIEPEAAILLVGQVHAEEVVGVEIVLEVMRQILDNNEENIFRQRLEGLELYLIPTANPEGLEIVHSGVDLTFRKNCRDNIGDGELRIQDGAGWDTSGVDINRNFGVHWDRGDTLFLPEENYRYNAFRGAAPFSEPESQTLRDLALQRSFLYSIVYHGSRSGNSAEMLIAPWFWRENNIIKRPPDASAINALGEALAERMPKQNDPDEHYRPAQSMQRKGQLQDWFYVETGSFQYMAEVGAEIQPDEEGMRQVVDDNLTAVWYMMDLALGLEGLDGFGTLTVIADDASTGEPMNATIVVDAIEHPILTPRHTNQYNGRFDWLLEAGEHNIAIKKQGYETQTFENYEINSGERTVIETGMEPLHFYAADFGLDVNAPGNAEEAVLNVYDLENEIVYDQISETLLQGVPLGPWGLTSVGLFAGDFKYLVTSPGHLPITGKFTFRDQEEALYFNLPPADMAYEENFGDDLDWQRGGDNEDWGITTFDGRSCLTESVTGDYPTDADVWLQLDDIVRLDTAQATMRIIHLPYCEPGDDYQEISWWTNPEEVHSKRYTQLRKDWDTLYVSLDSLEAGMLNVRFNIISDAAIGEDGWLIDQIAVFKAGIPGFIPIETAVPRIFSVQSFPNPFNSTTTIRYNLALPGLLSLQVYNPLGQQVSSLFEGYRQAGFYSLNLNAADLPSGLYFVRLEAAGDIRTRKIMLIR